MTELFSNRHGLSAEWQLVSMKRAYEIKLGKMLQCEKSGAEDIQVQYLRAANIRPSGICLDDVKIMWASPQEAKNLLLKEGDLLISEGGDVGRSAIISSMSELCIFQNSVNRARPIANNSAKFAYYWLCLIKENGFIDALCNKSTIAHYTAEKLGATPILLPPAGSQIEIAEFLDRETAEIDALIEKLEQLISLSMERIITTAKSALSLPRSRWHRLGRVCDHITRPVVLDVESEFIRLGLYNRGRGIFHKARCNGEEIGDSSFHWAKEGDLIISGQFAWEGAVAIANAHDTDCVVSHRYHILRGIEGMSTTEYLLALLQTDFGDMVLNECSRGSAGRNRPLNIGLLLKEKVPLPSLESQFQLAQWIGDYQELKRKVRGQKMLLNERRAALISAAVTGEIDVTGRA